MRLEGLKFVMLGSTDIDRSVAFYRERLGLPLLHRFEGFAFFDGGTTTIALTADLGGRIAGGATFASEIVFGVPSVGESYAELSGVAEFVNEPRAVNGDAWAATCKDPDGHLVTFYGAP